MKTGFKQMVIALISILAFALPGYAGQLDDYYLAAFGQQPGSALEKAVLLQTTVAGEAAHCGTPLKHGLSRDWNKLEAATQKVLAKQLALPTLSGTPPPPLTSSNGHFIIHYTTSGNDAPNINDYTVNGILYHGINYYTGLNLTSAADWAKKVGDTFEFAYSFYQTQGYHPPPNIPYDVYLTDLASVKEYGETQTIGTPPTSFPFVLSSFIQIDKDFTNDIFHPTTFTPLQSLQITSAHEFHHAIQYGYNYYFDVWYAEVTSTWFEDEVWPAVGQNYSYIAAWFQNSTRQLDLAVDSSAVSTGAGYGRWIFNRYLSEKHTTAVVRSFWEKLAGIAPVNGQDIPMVPVIDSVLSSATYNSTLATDFFGFAKRVYVRDWPTTTTITTADIGMIPTYSPVATYSTYPVNNTATLPHYSFAYYKFTPTTNTLTLTITKTSGIQTAVFRKVGGSISEVAVNSGGASYTASGLSPTTDEVVLLIANITDVDNHQASFSTDDTSVAVTEPTTTPIPSTATTSGGGGGGCFIATAAYGSYLHPQVQLLRDFRDEYLLTNAPGRAFVALYYRCSPPLADFIARHSFLRAVTRLALTPLVIAVAHPLIAAVSLFLLFGALFVSLLRRLKGTHSNARPYTIRTTSSRF